jgi:NADH-quinone oxidoreductase subunit C
VTETAHVQSPALPLDEGLAGVLAAEAGVDAAAVIASRDGHGVLCLDVPATSWVAAATFLRDRCGLDYFDWLSAVDAPDAEPPGVEIVLHVADSFSTVGHGHGDAGADGPRVRRALLRTRVANGVAAPSLTGVWRGAGWHERETFEMFGVVFDGYDDGSGLPLRKLLLTDEFEGNPLRKSFILAARASKPWPGAKEPGESDAGHGAPSRRKTLPPGVPEPGSWGRDAGTPKPEPAPAAGPAARGTRGDRPARTPREPRVPREPRAARPAPESDGGAQ